MFKQIDIAPENAKQFVVSFARRADIPMAASFRFRRPGHEYRVDQKQIKDLRSEVPYLLREKCILQPATPGKYVIVLLEMVKEVSIRDFAPIIHTDLDGTGHVGGSQSLASLELTFGRSRLTPKGAKRPDGQTKLIAKASYYVKSVVRKPIEISAIRVGSPLEVIEQEGQLVGVIHDVNERRVQSEISLHEAYQVMFDMSPEDAEVAMFVCNRNKVERDEMMDYLAGQIDVSGFKKVEPVVETKVISEEAFSAVEEAIASPAAPTPELVDLVNREKAVDTEEAAVEEQPTAKKKAKAAQV